MNVLKLGSDQRYYIDSPNGQVAIADPWNTRSGLLEEPRYPASEAIWKPIGAAVGEEGGWLVYLGRMDGPTVVEWRLDAAGAFTSQRDVPAVDVAALLRDAVIEGSGEHAPELLNHGGWVEARRTALRALRHSPRSYQALETLIRLHAARGRTLQARRLLGKLRKLNSSLRRKTELVDSQEQAIFAAGFKAHAQGCRILYLVQNAERLPDEIEKAMTSLDNNFICLTFKRPVYDDRYIYYPNSSWTEGRNLLYRLCRENFQSCDYYVFCDGDLAFSDASAFDGINLFQKFLLEERPEIAVPATTWHSSWGSYYDPDLPEVHVSGFDAMFNAFRRDAFFGGILFPYLECFDSSSWYSSQLALIYLSNIFYDAIQLNKLDVYNTDHAEYPKFDIGAAQVGNLVKLVSGFDPLKPWDRSEIAKRARRLLFNRALRDKIFKTGISAQIH